MMSANVSQNCVMFMLHVCVDCACMSVVSVCPFCMKNMDSCEHSPEVFDETVLA